MTIANLRYGHLESPWDSPISLGVQAFIEYNGLVLNDRNQADRIRVTGILGLDSAEIRDSREPRPGQHGEFVYDAFFGGRNVVLSGTIEAGSLGVSNELKRNLLAAFAPLVESPLKFRWFDIYDNFDEAQTILPYNPIASGVTGNYEALIGANSNFSVENGFLSWANSGEDYLIRASEKRVYGDVQSTFRIIPGSLGVASTFGIIFGVINKENYCVCLFSQNSGEPNISVQTVVNNKVYELGAGLIPMSLIPEIGKPFYFRGKKEGNHLTAEYWQNSPEEYNLPTLSISAELEGTDASSYGDGAVAQVGFGGNQKDTLWKFEDYHIESIYPGDVVFNARCTTAPQIKDEQTSPTRFKRSFMITLRSSDFRAFTSAQLQKSFVPNNTEGSILGRGYKRSYPRDYRFYISSSVVEGDNIIGINNRGTVFVEPVLVQYGPFTSLSIRNLTNGQEISFEGNILENDYLVFDCRRRKTLNNSVGENKLEDFKSSSSAWIVLEPMWNDIYIVGTGLNGNSRFVAYWSHGYLG